MAITVEKNNADDNEDQQGLEMHKHSMELNICESILNINKKNIIILIIAAESVKVLAIHLFKRKARASPKNSQLCCTVAAAGSVFADATTASCNDSFLHSRVAVFRRQVCRQGLTLF